jgi:hypothetical protein
MVTDVDGDGVLDYADNCDTVPELEPDRYGRRRLR